MFGRTRSHGSHDGDVDARKFARPRMGARSLAAIGDGRALDELMGRPTRRMYRIEYATRAWLLQLGLVEGVVGRFARMGQRTEFLTRQSSDIGRRYRYATFT